MNLKAAAAAVLAALLATGTATVGASTPPDSGPGSSESSTTAEPTSSSRSEVTTTVTIVVDSEPPADESTTVPTGTSAAAGPSSDPPAAATTAPVQSDQNQTVVVTATVVADANTGNNLVAAEGAGGTGSSVPAEIATGDATAVGSDDSNVVTQGAEVVLDGAATANLLQLALIINVGAAFANSGLNSVSAGGGPAVPGAIGTGDASATGLDIEQYITQAARQNAGAGESAESEQLAISMWMGLATANSGSNAVAGTGVAAGGGAVGTGDASATGNDSHTEIEQYAQILGLDQSSVSVTQRATVLNLGFALANTGLNDVSNVASGLLTAAEQDDDTVAQQLFAMLLPAMLQSYGYGPAQGTVDTGSATAVGNESDTFVRQVAMAAASGNGQVDIVQDVIVANMGAAAANSGGNSLGSVRPLDEETATAVVTMAAFMAELLSLVQRSADTTVLEAQRQGIEIPFQGLLLRLDGSFEGLDTQVASGGSQANVRQVSIVVSLGLAQANTGGNVTQSNVQQGNTVNALRAGDAIAVLAVDENGNVITTGDATAANQEVVVICQRINADDVDCLAPPTTTTVPAAPPTTAVGPATTAPPGATTPVSTPGTDPVPTDPAVPPPAHGVRPPVPTGTLPATGSASIEVVIAGLASLLTGAVLMVVTRRRVLP